MPKPKLDQTETVQLGRDHIYEIVPQPLPLLKRDLADYWTALTALDAEGVDPDKILDIVSGQARDLLKVFIPDVMPEHEWEGYATADAMSTGQFDRAIAARAPTAPQIRLAVTVAFKVNGLDVHKLIGRFVDPTVLKAQITVWIADFLKSRSPSESSAPGATPSTISTSPASPTEDDTGDSSLRTQVVDRLLAAEPGSSSPRADPSASAD